MSRYICPLCKQTGDEVLRITVENIVLNHFKKYLKSSEYGFCKNPDCSIVYFNNETDEILYQRDLKVPVWFKNQENPIICYCGNVTYKDIIEEVVVKKTSSTLADLIKNTNVMKNCRCKTMNPSGKCCQPVVCDVLEHALELRNEPKK